MSAKPFTAAPAWGLPGAEEPLPLLRFFFSLMH
jgi:hypothetical protein